MWQRYGDLVRVRFLLWPGYLLYHPDHVKHVLHDHHRNYNKQSPLLDSFRLFFGNGLFTNNGESWLHQRRLIEDLSIYWQSGPIHASQAHRHELLHKPCLNRYSGSGRF